MAGRGQHFIPRHFQKPFVIAGSRDQLWMYIRGKEHPVLVRRGDAGKERDFYSSPSKSGDVTLDDIITEYEQKLFAKVDQIRSIEPNAFVDPDIAAEVVAHFVIRSRHIRQTITELWDGLAKTIFALATDPSSVVGPRRLPAHRAPNALIPPLKEQILKHQINQLTGIGTDTLIRLFYMGFREQLDHLTHQARVEIAAAFSNVDESARERIRDVHTDMLRGSMAPPKRVAKLRELSWTVVEHAAGPAILPDCVCIAADAAGAWQPLLLVNQVDIAVVPLTPSTLLLGKRDRNQPFDHADFNSLAATACFDFFLSSDKITLSSLSLADLGKPLRSEIQGMVSENILKTIDSYLRVVPTEQAAERNRVRREASVSDRYDYQVTLYDFGDEVVAKKLGDALQEIIKEAEPGDAAESLDGFTFAHQYEAAIFSLERGFQPQSDLKTEHSSLGIGVAMPLTVLRDDVLKTRFILRDFLAHDLLSEDLSERTSAMHMIRYLVAGLTLDHLKRGRFAGWMLQRISTPVEGYFSAHAGGIFDVYFGMRKSASSLEQASDFVLALCDQLPDLIADCVQRRRDYRIDGELDKFFEVILERTRVIVSHLASILGVYAAVEGVGTIPVKVRDLLRSYDMGDWVTLFANDLSHFYDNLDGWSDYEEIFFVNRHFERFLLMFGVVIEEVECGKFYAHVPFGPDVEYLSGLESKHV